MTDRDRARYSRQILFSPLGEQGQRRLLGARAAVVGCGALGSFHAAALARAGVGKLTLIDRDYVEESNLQRQWLYTEADAAAALPKAVAAMQAIAAINSGVDVRAEVVDLRSDNIADLLAGADVVLDGTDNFDARYLLNDYCIRAGLPWIYGGAVAGGGVVMPVLPGETACLACIFPEPPASGAPTCETAGVLASATAAVAAFQVAEALKILSGARHEVEPRLLSLDVWQGAPRALSTARRDPDCRACGRREFPFLDVTPRRPAALCGRNAVQVHDRDSVDLDRLASLLRPLGEVRANEYAVRFRTPPYEMTVFADGRAIIKGVDDVGLARSLYARYVGA